MLKWRNFQILLIEFLSLPSFPPYVSVKWSFGIGFIGSRLSWDILKVLCPDIDSPGVIWRGVKRDWMYAYVMFFASLFSGPGIWVNFWISSVVLTDWGILLLLRSGSIFAKPMGISIRFVPSYWIQDYQVQSIGGKMKSLNKISFYIRYGLEPDCTMKLVSISLSSCVATSTTQISMLC